MSVFIFHCIVVIFIRFYCFSDKTYIGLHLSKIEIIVPFASLNYCENKVP